MIIPSWSSLFDEFERMEKAFIKPSKADKWGEYTHKSDNEYVWDGDELVYSSEKEWDGDKLVKDEVVDKIGIERKKKTQNRNIPIPDNARKYKNTPDKPIKIKRHKNGDRHCCESAEGSVRIDADRHEELVRMASEGEQWKTRYGKLLEEYDKLQQKNAEISNEIKRIKEQISELLG